MRARQRGVEEGAADVVRRREDALVALQRRPAFVALFAAATLWSCALTSAAALHYQGKLVWGVEDDVPARYERLRQRIDRFFGVPHDHPTPNER